MLVFSPGNSRESLNLGYSLTLYPFIIVSIIVFALINALLNGKTFYDSFADVAQMAVYSTCSGLVKQVSFDDYSRILIVFVFKMCKFSDGSFITTYM